MPPNLPLEAWLARLERLHPVAIDLGLERVREVADALGLKPAFPLIIVGGTNGKGSTCAYLEAMLRAAGYRTGLYTSPHLLRYNERVRVCGIEADDAELVADFERIEAARGAVSLTYYEFGTLSAMRRFVDGGVDVAILEVGLGGRLDAVNIFDADASIVTSIDLDHQHYLGDTREKIGFEKAGIYRAARPAICADPAPPASLRAHIAALGAQRWQLGDEFDFAVDGAHWRYRGRGWRLADLPRPAMHGTHQLRNAAGAIAVLEALRERLPVDPAAIARGLRDARLAGRFQCIAEQPEIMLDVAHNPEAARALASLLDAHPVSGRTLAVVGMLADKDAAGVIAALLEHIDSWWICTPDSPRAMPASTFADCLRQQAGDAVASVCDSAVEALEMAQRQAGVDDRILVFGSFYTVAAVLPHARSRR